MGQTRPNSSSTDEYARRIARAITKGQPPRFSADLDRYCDGFPREIFASVAGAARHMPPSGEDETLAFGYLFLLQRQLEHLRYRTDRGDVDAAGLIADFQADIAAQVEAGDVDGHLLTFIAGALHQSKIPASPELVAASARRSIDHDEGRSLPADVGAALGEILEACNGDPFVVVGSLTESSHAMPAEARGSLAGAMALSGIPEGRAAAVLFLLDADSTVRRTVAGALGEVAAALTPTDVRRLIAMRNWRPKAEQADVDTLIHKARVVGIDSAQWEAGSIEAVVATAIDGAATQGFLLVSPAGRKKRLLSVLTKGGIADAWAAEPESRRQIEATLASSGMTTPTIAVSRSYLDRAVAHHLALSTDKGEAPPLGLLQVAETIGGADWQPERMSFNETLDGLIAEVPDEMLRPAAFAAVLQSSDQLADLDAIEQSWFEDDAQIAEAVEHARSRGRAKLATYLLQGLMAQRRDRWADIVLRTALWMREAPPEANLCWRELAIVAKALTDGQDMAEIGLMRDIALRTIAVLRDADRM